MRTGKKKLLCRGESLDLWNKLGPNSYCDHSSPNPLPCFMYVTVTPGQEQFECSTGLYRQFEKYIVLYFALTGEKSLLEVRLLIIRKRGKK